MGYRVIDHKETIEVINIFNKEISSKIQLNIEDITIWLMTSNNNKESNEK